MTLAKHPALVLVHGLDGSSESPYMLGIAEMAFEAGFNVLRLNQRNCGGTAHLTPTLQNSGLSTDYRSVLEELITRHALQEVFFTGYSVGGNLVLKMAGELGADAPWELRQCALSVHASIWSPARMAAAWRGISSTNGIPFAASEIPWRKAKLFPELYHVEAMARVRTMREWHEPLTAPAGGYRNAAEYYQEASALRVAGQIRVPTLIVTAQDDPFIPFESFHHPAIVGNRSITLMAPEHGGHCAFISRNGGRERFWAESRVVEFCAEHSEIVGFGQAH